MPNWDMACTRPRCASSVWLPTGPAPSNMDQSLPSITRRIQNSLYVSNYPGLKLKLILRKVLYSSSCPASIVMDDFNIHVESGSCPMPIFFSVLKHNGLSQLIDFSTHKRAYIWVSDYIFHHLGVVDSALSDHILITTEIQLAHRTPWVYTISRPMTQSQTHKSLQGSPAHAVSLRNFSWPFIRLTSVLSLFIYPICKTFNHVSAYL